MGGITPFGVASVNAWMLGRADLAREREARMMALATTNPYAAAWKANFAAQLRACLREYEQAENLATRALALCEQHQFTLATALVRATLGDARARLGRAAEGIALIRRGITEMLELGVRFFVSVHTAHLAAALGREGALHEALETIEQALQLNPDETSWRPETFTIRGELRLKQGQAELAEAAFRESLAFAQKMGAKAWELRTTMSLARLLASQRRCDEARTMLSEIYGWFTEGFDTADLKEAKALLDELAG
jgi:tetratricopeptide (TPR) repeat protein